MIKASDYIETGFSANDSQKLVEAIQPIFDKGDKIVVDFEGITIFTTLFFNNSFAKFLMLLSPEKYEERFFLENLSELGENTYKHSIENAKDYYNLTQSEKKTQDEVLENPDD